MTSVSTINLVVFLALLSPAFGHKCMKCFSANSTECEETEVDCGNSSCYTNSQIYTNGGLAYHTMEKGCNGDGPCDVHESMTQCDNAKIRANRQCCTGDLCNKNLKFEIPPDNKKPTVMCPSCYSQGTLEKCVSDKTEQCYGPDDRCLEFIGNVTNPDGSNHSYSMKTCVNGDGCKYKFDGLTGIKGVHIVVHNCTDGMPSNGYN